MSEGGRDDGFERMLASALAVEPPPRLAARVSQAVRERRERRAFWRVFSPGRIALIGSLALAGGAAVGFLVPLANLLDADTLMVAAFAGSLS